MALMLAPMLPGGTLASDVERVASISAHSLRFRLGWLPWQLCAVADLALAVAMVRARWLPRAGSVIVLVLTCCAVLPDQYAQLVWVTRGVTLAGSNVAAYLALEKRLFPLTAGWGALFYTLGALGWTWCFVRAGTWSRALTWLTVPLFVAMGFAVVSPILPATMRPASTVIAAANAVGFVILQVWLLLVTEEVLRRARPTEGHGRWALWRYPSSSPLARILDALANSRFFGVLLEPIPELTMRSDITDVVYVNYLVDAALLTPFVPSGLELQTLGPSKKHALFTFLTYRHGHFGFAFLGPLRRLMPSPIQTNWRVHVVDPKTGHRGITFVTNAVTHVVPALAARLTTEGMPMHVLHHAVVEHTRDGGVEVTLDAGSGSAPDAEARLTLSDEAPPMEGAWGECFENFRAFLAYCVPQDRAMSSQPLRLRISRQEIDLGIPLDACIPLRGTVTSRAARAIVGDAEPICFRVPSVKFEFSEEAHDRRIA